MWSKRHEFQLSVKLGLRRGLSLIRGMRRAFTDEEQDKIAGAIVEQVEFSNGELSRATCPRAMRAS